MSEEIQGDSVCIKISVFFSSNFMDLEWSSTLFPYTSEKKITVFYEQVKELYGAHFRTFRTPSNIQIIFKVVQL